MNKVILSGRLTKNPELKQSGTQNERAISTFNLAVDKGLSRDKREQYEFENKPTADFPRITIFGRQAENAYRYLKKGSQCLVEGRIQTGSYDDKDTGKKIFTTDVIADRVEFLDTSNNQNSNAQSNQNNNEYKYKDNPRKSNRDDFEDDLFGEDFQPIEDDGRIPF